MTRTPAERLKQLIDHASADEVRVLLLLAERLTAGRSQYGPLRLDTDRRDFAHEAIEEAADLLMYWAMQMLRSAAGAMRR